MVSPVRKYPSANQCPAKNAQPVSGQAVYRSGLGSYDSEPFTGGWASAGFSSPGSTAGG
jgi:hypothetical protein